MTTYETRHFDIEARAAGDGIECSLSSEYPVDRAWGREVLVHTAEAIDLSRSPLPLIESHDTQRLPVGVIDGLRVVGRKLRGTIRFGNSARAQELAADARAGILRSLSIGYSISKTEQAGDAIRVTRWAPHECSLVSVPADPTVGIGRSLSKGTQTMNYDTDTQEQQSRSQRRAENRALADERERTQDILAIGENYGLQSLAAEAVRDGCSLAEFQKRCIEAMSTRARPTADISLGDNWLMGSSRSRETREYSLVRAITAAATGDWSKAGYEREVSKELERQSGRAARSLMVPLDALAPQRRDLTVGTATAGGNLVETVHGGFVDMLRQRSVVLSRATWLTGLSGNVDLPRQTGAATAYWVAENGAATESQQSFDRIELRPKSVSAFTDISRRMMLQTGGAIEQLVRNDLTAQLSIALETAAVNGSGSGNQPVGVLNTSGIGAVAIGTNGGAPTWAHMVGLETALTASHADTASLAYITNGAVRGKLRTTETATGSGQFVWQGTGEPGMGTIGGYAAAVSQAVPSNLTKGTSSGVCSAVILGNWSDLLIGQWGGLDLLVDPYSNSSAGIVRVVAFMDVDVAVRYAESFAAIKDALTA